MIAPLLITFFNNQLQEKYKTSRKQHFYAESINHITEATMEIV